MRKIAFLLIAVIILFAATADAGLLTGQTPSNYTLPSGWTLIRTQDFEGSVPGDEYHDGSITTALSHTGSKSVRGQYSGDGHTMRWMVLPSGVGSFSEVYVSMWEYMESQARFNDELHSIRFEKRNQDSSLAMQVVFDISGGFNTTNGGVWQINEGEGEGAGGFWESNYGPTIAWGQGTWVQWEVHFRPNTVGVANGFFRVYKNGSLVFNVENKMFNGYTDFQNGGVQVEVGGVYTKHIWYTDYPTNTVCATSYGDGVGYERELNWNNPCACPNQCPPTGYVPIFYRYFDDIIVMKTTGDTQPPPDTQTAFYVQYTRPTDWTDNTTYTIGITAQDIYTNTLNETYTFRTATATPEVLAVTTTTLANAKVGDLYTPPALAATGGVTPYTWDNVTVLPAGLLIPSSGTGSWGVPTATFSDNITIRATDSMGATDNQVISFTVDAADIPEFPTVEIGTVEDTYMISGSMQNFSTGDELFVYTWPTSVAANRILMKWDLSSVSGTVPTSATLRLYMTGYDGTGGDNTYMITARRITGVNPTVSTASWVYYDGTNSWTGGADGGIGDAGDIEATADVTKTPQFITLNVTDMVKAWLITPASNKGMLISPPLSATQDSNRHFASVDNPTAAYRPVLFLTYVPTPSPIQSLTVGQLTGGIIQ